MSIEIQIGANIGGVDKAIAKVGDSLEGIQSVAQQTNTNLNNLSSGITNVESSLQGVQSVASETSASLKTLSTGISNSAKNLKDVNPVAQKAQNTLTGLSGVVRDLPFGFIAIQNNLPILVDQLSSLSKESGGVGGALKGLGGALIGPAGIAFAFGAVTSLVTGLIQEYGSLGNAIDVILGITKPLTEAQKAFNKASYETAGNLAAEEAKVNILTKRLTDSKVPQADRLAAYNELKKIAPDVVSGISRENALTAESNLLIQANSKLRAESVRLKVQEAGITAALTTNETKIAELRAKLEKANAKYVQSAKDLNKVNKDALITGFGSQTAQESALTAFNNNASAVNELQSQIKALSTEIQTYLNQLEPVAAGLAAINDKTFQNIEALKESNKETKQGESDSKKRAAALLREAKALEKKIVAERQARSLRVPLEVSVTIADIGKQDFGKLYKEKIINKFKEAQKASGGIQIPANLPTIDTSKILQSLIDVQNATKERRAAILKEANLQAAADLFKSTFFDPVQNLFTDLLNGADGAFKAFTKAVLQAINQIVAKIIATGIISLLANLISGGTAGLGKAVIGDILGVIGIKKERIGNPNFGGIGAGGMQMSGAVNVVLRGQDLVGALNRTNAQINRVG